MTETMPCFPNMERGEYWIIDAVLEASLSLSSLIGENIEEAFNREGHGLTDFELVDTLCHLFQGGDLIAYYSHVVQASHLIRGNFVPTKEEIIAAIQGNSLSNLCYKLTVQGGTRWESISNPNWNLYYTPIHSEQGINNKSFIAGGSRRILEEFLTYQIAHPFINVDISSIKWELLEPWEATYWKRLPVGYLLSYLAEDIPCNSQEEIIKADMFNFCFFQWQNSNKWYINYSKINK